MRKKFISEYKTCSRSQCLVCHSAAVSQFHIVTEHTAYIPNTVIYKGSFHRGTDAFILMELDHLKQGPPKGMGCRRGQIIHAECNE